MTNKNLGGSSAKEVAALASGSVSRGDRLVAALSHLGVPIYGPFLPLIIFFSSKSSSFRQRHANQGFSFQCAFLAVWTVLTALMLTEVIDQAVLLLVGSCAAVLEAPNVVRAMRGQPPVLLVPVALLRPPAPESSLPPPPS